MESALIFEQDNTRKLLTKLDFSFFINQNIESNNYDQDDVDTIHSSYKKTLVIIKSKAKKNKKQFNYYTDGQVRKMFNGGLLPAIFELDETREFTITNFESLGENWAYFKYWQHNQKIKIATNAVWELVIKIGSVLGILLSLFELYRYK